MLPLLAVLLTAQSGSPEYPRRITVDVLRGADPRQLLLSDDGRMAFNFSGQCRRAFLPDGPLVEGDLIVLLDGEQVTMSQAAHLTGKRTLFSPVPLASPCADRALLGGLRPTLVNFKARGDHPNPSVDILIERIVRPLGGGAYLVLGLGPKGAAHYRIDTANGRLKATRIGGALPEHRAPTLPDAPGRRDVTESPFLSDRAWGDEPILKLTAEGQGRFTVHEWVPGTPTWRSLPAPIDPMSGPPRILRVGRRLFLMRYMMGGPGSYEAAPNRKSWRKVSDKVLLTVSANRAFCLTLDAKTGDAYVERFVDFARPR